jgi:predicted metalloprotease with PDZ domain
MPTPCRTFAAGAFLVSAVLLLPPFQAPGSQVLAAAGAGEPITIALDASEAPRKIFHVRLEVPAPPGPLTLLYPKWIPGEHGPSGPIVDLAGLTISAAGRTIPWRRDPADMFTFHCEVPQGAAGVEVTLDFLSPAAAEGFTAGASATSVLAVISWNQVLLYPAGPASDDLTYSASLKLPPGWKYGTSLPVAADDGQTVRFKPVSLTTLVDSPVITGAVFRKVPLRPQTRPPHEIDMASDSAAALEMTPGLIEAHSRLVDEALALFGAAHYREYRFLYTLSDHTAHFGLEHHESSDNRVPGRTLVDEDTRRIHAHLLPHEMVHSWNGKYRRPADLATPDYQEPMRSDLLWIYEGLTHYLGYVLTVRSGLESPDLFRQELARIASDLSHRPGREWRPLVDTAVTAQILYGAPEGWAAHRRGVDFYSEGVLIWLEADMIVRQRSKGQRSLDDFCRRFLGGTSGPPEVKTYTADDVYAALGEIAPYDWKGFFKTRVYDVAPRAPLAGIEASGWRLSYGDERTDFLKSQEAADGVIDLTASIGMTLRKGTGERADAIILDAVTGMAAAAAGIGPGMRLVAVNSRRFAPEVLRDALRATREKGEALDLLVENAGYFRTFRLDYGDGERYPVLERDGSKPDLLGEILRPRARSAAAAPTGAARPGKPARKR